MTAEEAISVARLAKQVDEMKREMVTKDLLKTEVGRIDTALNAHVEYTKMANAAEAKRLDAIREVDATAIKVANDRAVEQAALLAKQVESVASTLRELVSTTAAAAAETQAQLFTPINNRLDKIEGKQNEDRGKATFADPMLTALVAKMESIALTLSKAEGKTGVTDPMLDALNAKVDALAILITKNEGKDEGMGKLWGWIVSGIMLVLAIAARVIK